MRTTRTNGGTTYKYVYNGSQLTQMTVGGNTLSFIYDATGAPVVVVWNGVPYYYVTTLQGDVLVIMDLAGDIVVSYDYDAWGKILTIGGSMASTLGTLNPLRYRGYVYDQETGLYYLQSRYYNPEWGRFLNADVFVSTGQGLLGNNMFAYCLNNPVCLEDSLGALPKSTYDLQQLGSGNSGTVANNPQNTPPNHPAFKPPKKGNKKVKNPNGQGNGWIDANGDVWIWQPKMHGGEGWIIQEPGGGHRHAYPGGGIRTHRMDVVPLEDTKTIFPAMPQESHILVFPKTEQIPMTTVLYPNITAPVIVAMVGGGMLMVYLTSYSGGIEWT